MPDLWHHIFYRSAQRHGQKARKSWVFSPRDHQISGQTVEDESEARATAMIIGSLPFVIGGLLYLIRPDYILTLFDDPLGHALLVGGAVMMSLGVFIMKQMITFEV